MTPILTTIALAPVGAFAVALIAALLTRAQDFNDEHH